MSNTVSLDREELKFRPSQNEIISINTLIPGEAQNATPSSSMTLELLSNRDLILRSLTPDEQRVKIAEMNAFYEAFRELMLAFAPDYVFDGGLSVDEFVDARKRDWWEFSVSITIKGAA